MMKNGKLRKPGDVLEIDASSAALLASKDCVEIPGYTVKKVTREVVVDALIPNEEADK
ncbi:MAG: hypothetical protein KJI72_04200 [Patescibacteria group bacterium]|nr:hypothetical protein [Patescibacteria group bacterium]